MVFLFRSWTYKLRVRVSQSLKLASKQWFTLFLQVCSQLFFLHCSCLALMCVAVCPQLVPGTGTASPKLLDGNAHESISAFPSTDKKMGVGRRIGNPLASLFSHSSAPSSTHYPQPKGRAWPSHWSSPRRKSPRKEADRKKWNSLLCNWHCDISVCVAGCKNTRKWAREPNWEYDCQEVECRSFWPERREESLIRMCWEIVVSLRAIGPFHVYIMHMHGLEQSSETRYPIPHSVPLKV